MVKIEKNAKDLWTVVNDGDGLFAGTLDDCVTFVKARHLDEEYPNDDEQFPDTDRKILQRDFERGIYKSCDKEDTI